MLRAGNMSDESNTQDKSAEIADRVGAEVEAQEESLRVRVKEELETIRLANGGLLLPQDVVDFARNPETALHRKFDWDDSEAAEKWRRQQARQVIKVHVIIPPAAASAPTQVVVKNYHHVPTDKKGYRAIEDISASKQMRDALLRRMVQDIQTFRAKHAATMAYLKNVTAFQTALQTMEDEARESLETES